MDTELSPTILFLTLEISINPITIGMLIGFIISILLLYISGILSAAEVAFFSLSTKEINELQDKNSNAGKRILYLLKDKDRLWASIMLGNIFVNIALVILLSTLTNLLFNFSKTPLLGFLSEAFIITLIILFWGEMMPKLYAANNNVKIVQFISLPLIVLTKILNPLGLIYLKFTSTIKEKNKNNISLSDLSEALDLTSSQTEKEDQKILKGIVEFGNIDVNEIMCPRTEVVSIAYDEPLSKLLSLIVESEYSRIPVYKESVDTITGIIFVKDLLPYIHHKNDFQWTELIRPAYFVPESKKINELLNEFQKGKIHMAIVVDEYGGTSGIVTMEDILEEIVGEIADETDKEDNVYTKLSDNSYLFEGKILLHDFFKITQTNDELLNEFTASAETLAGLILEIKGEIPSKREIIVQEPFKFVIESVDKRKIHQVKVTINIDNNEKKKNKQHK